MKGNKSVYPNIKATQLIRLLHTFLAPQELGIKHYANILHWTMSYPTCKNTSVKAALRVASSRSEDIFQKKGTTQLANWVSLCCGTGCSAHSFLSTSAVQTRSLRRHLGGARAEFFFGPTERKGKRAIGNRKLLETSASLLVTSALLVVTRSYQEQVHHF